MPWFDPLPSNGDIDFWSFAEAPQRHKVSLHPRPNSARVNCFFLLEHTHPPLIRVAGRYGLRMRLDEGAYDAADDEFSAFGAFDFAGIAKNHIQLLAGQNAGGFTVTIDIKAFDELFVAGTKGVEVRITAVHATYGTQHQTGEFERVPTTRCWQHNHNTLEDEPFAGWQYSSDASWTIGDMRFDLFAVSDCYEFKSLCVGFAEFNGEDSWIDFQISWPLSNIAFFLECDIRLHDVTTFWPILGRDGLGGFFGMDDNDLIFGNLRLPTSWTPVLDTWFHFLYRFEHETQLQHELYIDDVEVLQTTSTRQFLSFDVFGVYKKGVSGTIWGNFDMKNFKRWQGNAEFPNLIADINLICDAVDRDDGTYDGTTHNMALPSV